MKSANPDTLKQAKDHGVKSIVFGIAQVPESTTCYIGTSDFTVAEVDFAAEKFEPKALYSHESYVTTVTLAGSTLISGGYDGKLTWYDTQSKSQIRSEVVHDKWVRKLATSPNGKLIASVADDMACKIWNVETGKLVHDLRGHSVKTPNHFGSMLYSCVFSYDGQYLATVDKIGHIIVWDVVSGKSIAEMDAPIMYTWDVKARLHSIGGIRSVAFSPDGKQLAVGGTGKIGNIDHLEANARIEIFDWQAKKQIGEYVGDKSKGIVNKLQFSDDGAWLLGAGGAGDGFLMFIDPKAKKVTKQEKAPMHVHDFSLTEKTLFAVGHNKVVRYTLG
jgi:WD40 repeat protein